MGVDYVTNKNEKHWAKQTKKKSCNQGLSEFCWYFRILFCSRAKGSIRVNGFTNVMVLDEIKCQTSKST